MSESYERTFFVQIETTATVDPSTNIAYANGNYYRVEGEALAPIDIRTAVGIVMNIDGVSFSMPMYAELKNWILSF